MSTPVTPRCRLCRAGFPLLPCGTVHHGNQRLGMIPDTPCMEEYLRRNLNVAKAAGAAAGARSILNKLGARKRVPKWLTKAVYDIYARAKYLPRELANYRDEAKHE